MPLVRVLFRLRSFPALVARRKGLPQAKHEPLLSQTVDFGFTVLGHDPGREIVAGAVAQIWKRGGRAAVIGDGAEFAAFDNPGYVKVATNFLLTHQDGGTRIETETRVLATEPESRRRSPAIGVSFVPVTARSGATGYARSRGAPSARPGRP
jgi:hypothetical protein